MDWTRPTAIVFGNEKDGVSAAALEAADRSVVIPMSGFAQSVNISVAAAVVLYEAREARVRAQGFHASLTPQQQRVLTAIMLLRCRVRTPPLCSAALLKSLLCTLRLASCVHVRPLSYRGGKTALASHAAARRLRMQSCCSPATCTLPIS